jgi:hypothetical protein
VRHGCRGQVKTALKGTAILYSAPCSLVEVKLPDNVGRKHL